MVTLRLGAPTVDGLRLDPGLPELAGDAVDAMAGAAEHDGGPCAADDVGCQRHPRRAGRRSRTGASTSAPSPVVSAGHVVHGVTLVAADQRVDVAIERCREEQGLAVSGREVEQPRTAGRNPMSAMRSASSTTTSSTPSRRTSPLATRSSSRPGQATTTLDALRQQLALRPVADPAVDGGDGPAVVLVDQGVQLALHLGGQLTGGHQHEGPGPSWLRRRQPRRRGRRWRGRRRASCPSRSGPCRRRRGRRGRRAAWRPGWGTARRCPGGPGVAHRGAGTPRSAKLRDNGTPIELTLANSAAVARAARRRRRQEREAQQRLPRTRFSVRDR